MISLLRTITRDVGFRIARIYTVRKGVSVGRGVHIGLGTILSSFSGLIVGDGVYIGKGCTIQVDGHIGRGTLIANRVGIIGRNDHDMHAIGVPIGYAPWIGARNGDARGKDVVEIGEDVWIGYGAVILSGVSVGRGAVIAAGAIVTRDVAAYTIAAGNPAKAIGTRIGLEERGIHEMNIDLFWQKWKGQQPVRSG